MFTARNMADLQQIKLKKGSIFCNEQNRPHNPFLSCCGFFWWSQLNISRIKIPHLGCCVYKDVWTDGVICPASQKKKKKKGKKPDHANELCPRFHTAPANIFFFRRFLLTRLTDFIGKKLKRFLLFVLMLSSIQNYIPFNDHNENNSNNRPGKVDTIKSPCIYVTTFFSTSPVHDGLKSQKLLSCGLIVLLMARFSPRKDYILKTSGYDAPLGKSDG